MALSSKRARTSPQAAHWGEEEEEEEEEEEDEKEEWV